MPPSAIQAEQGLLGALMMRNESFERVRDFLRAEHFVDPINAQVFNAIARHLEAGRAVDMITLAADFANSAALLAVGGTSYLAQLLASTPHPSVAPDYARAVVATWAKRRLIDAGEELVNGAFSELDIGAVLASAAAALDEVTAGASLTGAQSTSVGDAVTAALDHADAVARGDSAMGLRTGMDQIDEALGGLEAGNLVVLGGRPGSGKSSLAWQWAINVARSGTGVLAVSMEMTAIELGRRALSTVAGVPIWKMRRGQHAEDIGALLEARKELLAMPITIEDGGRASASDILAMARAAKRKHGLGLVIVDHLQIAKADDADQRNGSTAAVAGISHAMKELAKRMACPVLLLSQLNRALESRDDHRPTMSDLRQAGAIEEDADVVAFVYRGELHTGKVPPEQREHESSDKYAARRSAWYDLKAKNAGTAEFIIEKLRDGQTQTVPLMFNGPTASFYEILQEHLF